MENPTLDKATVQAVLDQIDAEIKAAEFRLEELRSQKTGALAFVARLAKLPAASGATSPGTVAGASATNNSTQKAPPRSGVVNGLTDFIRVLLAEHPGGVHLKDIEKQAAERGRDLSSEQVRSAVKYLKRQGQAENIDRGIWRSARRPTNAEPSAGTEGSVGITTTGTGGEANAQPEDHGNHQSRRDRDRRGGTSVTEVPSG